jgi:adenylate cyclase class IV
MDESEIKNLEFLEFETKYRVSDHLLVEFKQILEVQPDLKGFVYVEGPDSFFTYSDSWFAANPQWDPKGTFIRYRKPSFGLDKGRRQVTWKYKPANAKNNIQRKEHNWDIGETPEKVIIEQIQDSGAQFNASIIKNCHIYNFPDATLVFYVVYDTTNGKPEKSDYFVEIEVDEDTIHNLSEDQAWAVIEKYEAVLAPLGITAKNRLKKSLFEMYRK